MSLVYITHHNENIFDIDKKDSRTKREKLKYTSKYREMVKREIHSRHMINLDENRMLLTDSRKNYHQTMGCARTRLNPPCNYLRKNQGIQWQRLNVHKCPEKKPVTMVPRVGRLINEKPSKPKIEREEKRDEKTVCPNDSSHKFEKNFILININKMKSASARKRPPRYVDTPQGDVHNLLGTGLLPQYMCSKNFARVPCYLAERKKQLAHLNESCADVKMLSENVCAHFMNEIPGVRKMSSEERSDIINGLKKNFADVFKIYQSMSLYTDTVAKKLRKNKLENELRQLEQDILLMESNTEIYVNEC